MKALLRIAGFLVVVVALSGAAGYLYLQHELSLRQSFTGTNVILDVQRGVGHRDIVRMLHDRGVIANEYAALAYIFYTGNRGRLRAGEYMFDKPMTIPEVVDRLVKGSVYLHKFTVPEGLTVEETAKKWQDQGFGPAADFANAAREATSLILDLDGKAASLEGYLFPETYSFPSRTSPRQAIEAMVSRFRNVIEKMKRDSPAAQWERPLSEIVILASIVESEAAVQDERPLISSVYTNRLNKGILLQCDPTIVYALKTAGKYKGSLTLADLKYDSPYNTYVHPGLPPGPITNPGYASLEAALNPDSTNYLFFVRTTGGRHTFSENLAAHNRAVRQYRAMKRGI